MIRKVTYAGCIFMLALAGACTTQTATNPPPPALTPEAETVVETEADAVTDEQVTPVADAATGEPVNITDAEFENKVLQNSMPVMVDLWAAWCPPCRQLAPTVEELAGEYRGRVVVAKLDIDDNPETPQEYGVSAIPTMLFFKDGQLVEKLVGLHPKEKIAQVLDSLLKS